MRATLTFAIVSLTVGLARGGESEPNYRHLRKLAYFIGEWEMTGEVHWADRPVEPFVIKRTFAWTLGKSFIEARMIDVTEGASELRHKSMIGWDAKAESIKEWGFWNQKTPNKATVTWEVVTWAKDGKQWRIERDGLQGVLTIVDPNTHKYEAKFRGEDGSENSWHFTAKRKRPGKDAPAQLREYGEAMVGAWISHATVPWHGDAGVDNKAVAVPGRCSCRWILGGAALEWTGQIQDIRFRAMVFWDPSSEQLKVLGGDSDGVRFEGSLAKKGAGMWSEKTTLFLPDGKRDEIACTVKVEDGGAKHTNKYSNHKDTWVRVK